jgi:hypothetical protein
MFHTSESALIEELNVVETSQHITMIHGSIAALPVYPEDASIRPVCPVNIVSLDSQTKWIGLLPGAVDHLTG